MGSRSASIRASVRQKLPLKVRQFSGRSRSSSPMLLTLACMDKGLKERYEFRTLQVHFSNDNDIDVPILTFDTSYSYQTFAYWNPDSGRSPEWHSRTQLHAV